MRNNTWYMMNDEIEIIHDNKEMINDWEEWEMIKVPDEIETIRKWYMTNEENIDEKRDKGIVILDNKKW